MAVRAAKTAPEGGGDRRPSAVRAHCKSCNAQRTFHVQWVKAAADQPSEVIDLAQWVGLYFFYADEIGKVDSPSKARAMARRAAQCLGEALKFYGEEEMPPESAFRKAESVAAFRSNPANFAKTRLRELHAMLPVAADASDEGDAGPDQKKPARKAWWKIW